MSIVIGIDAGISSVKILGIEDGKRIKSPMTIKGDDAIAKIYGALGKYLHDNDIPCDAVQHIMVTGVGTKQLKLPILGIPTTAVDEFLANGRGARFDTGLDHMVVVSMGTGTSLVRVDGDDIKHIGGIGMGGGTLQGLAKLLLNTSDIGIVQDLAQWGTADKINLKIGDVCKDKIDYLMGDATASLFAGAIDKRPSTNEIAAGLIHMVLETIGSCAVLSQIDSGIKDFVLIGGLSSLLDYESKTPACKDLFELMENLYHVHFHVPQYAGYCTALGAALSYTGYEDE